MTTAGTGRPAAAAGGPSDDQHQHQHQQQQRNTGTTGRFHAGKSPAEANPEAGQRASQFSQNKAIYQTNQQASPRCNSISQQQSITEEDYTISRSDRQYEESRKKQQDFRSVAIGANDDCFSEHPEEELECEEEESLSEALLAVASAEEYAAKITKLQQACLTPLKEDLADWLNKILKSSSITTRNFMDKLDNGVIICRLAKIISLWCEQQLAKQTPQTTPRKADNFETTNGVMDSGNCDIPRPKPRTAQFINGSCPVKYSTQSQSTLCLANSTTSLNQSNLTFQSNQFLNNLTRMHQTKIWEDAKGRTFYARDNVCNFIEWSKEFGVNQSVLFESDDLVLHANPRQVVLCLLDVARIAYVKYGFTEAPGLVKFEQEIDREMAAAACLNNSHSSDAIHANLFDSSDNQPSGYQDNMKSSRAKNLRSLSVADATDELILRYCKHKEEEAARKRSEELATVAAQDKKLEIELAKQCSIDAADHQVMEADSLMPDDQVTNGDQKVTNLSSNNNNLIASHGEANLLAPCRADSLDSGEGPTDSTSTGFSRNPADRQSPHTTCDNADELHESTRSKRTSLSPTIVSQEPCSTPDSEVSSSHSSLSSSNQDGTNPSSGFGRQITSDLDGKVMRIAKSYYGKGATKDVTRLSEGKYKIADRIVFVRLLKGHRVMVRIGGGWDTLENFLFRHKSDPSQVIDVDNLLPLETKMSFEKSQQITATPTNLRPSKLPHYRRSNSASSTNLSISNLSISNHSIYSNNSPSHRIARKDQQQPVSNSVESSPARYTQQKIPYLLIHNGQKGLSSLGTPTQNHSTSYGNNGHRITNAQSGSTSLLKRPQPHFQPHGQQRVQFYNNKSNQHHIQRPLSASRASATSASNLYPATLTTRITPSSLKASTDRIANISTSHTNFGRTKTPMLRSENSRNSARPGDLIQAPTYNRSPNRKWRYNGSSHQLNGNDLIQETLPGDNYELNNDK